MTQQAGQEEGAEQSALGSGADHSTDDFGWAVLHLVLRQRMTGAGVEAGKERW